MHRYETPSRVDVEEMSTSCWFIQRQFLDVIRMQSVPVLNINMVFVPTLLIIWYTVNYTYIYTMLSTIFCNTTPGFTCTLKKTLNPFNQDIR